MPQFHFQSPHLRAADSRESSQYPLTTTPSSHLGPRLVGGTTFSSKPALDSAQIQILAHACLKSVESARQVILGWQRIGHALETIYILGISSCSSLLGQWWSSDEIDFAMNTIAHANLQRLLHDFSPEFLRENGSPHNGLSVLLLTEPGAQHSMGLIMLSQFFKREGWGVTVGVPQDIPEFKRLVHSDWFDAVGVSISTDRQLETLERLLPQLKASTLNKEMKVFVGGPLVMHEPERLKWAFADVLAENAPCTVRKVSGFLVPRMS